MDIRRVYKRKRIMVKDESKTVVYLWRYGRKIIGVE